jgi:hypothetical protein
MKRFLLLIALGTFSYTAYAQNPEYQFDAHGNRIVRGLHLKKDPNSGNGGTYEGVAEVDTLILEGLQAYPNPTHNWVNLELQGGKLYLKEVRVINSSGAIVWQAQELYGNQQIDFSTYASGRYTLWLRTAEGLKRIPIIKQ